MNAFVVVLLSHTLVALIYSKCECTKFLLHVPESSATSQFRESIVLYQHRAKVIMHSDRRALVSTLATYEPHPLEGYQSWLHSNSRPLGPEVPNNFFQSRESDVTDYGISLGITVGIVIAVGLVFCIGGCCLHMMDWCGKTTGRFLPDGKEDNLIVKWWPAVLVLLSSLVLM